VECGFELTGEENHKQPDHRKSLQLSAISPQLITQLRKLMAES